MFRLSVITDEVSQDLKTVVSFAKEYGLDGVEVRTLWGKNIAQMSKAEVNELKETLDGEGLEIPSLATPFFKCEVDSEEKIREHLDILRRSIELGDRLSCKLIRGFTFWRKGSYREIGGEVVDKFQDVLQVLQSAPGFVLGIENEAATVVGTGNELAEFLTDLGSPQVKGIWDPGNVVFVEDIDEIPYPDGYEAAKEHMIHFHLKDAKKDADGKPHWTLVGEGDIDYEGQFAALDRDGYTGYVSLETHWRPKELSKELVDRPGGAAYSEGGNLGSRLCMESTLRILEKLGLSR
jgi:sugar phosphate isomerase/epimerase